jgi:hypothetical protein
MNRGMMSFGLSGGLVILSVFVLSVFFAGKAFGAGSPAQLRELSAKEVEKMEQVIPAEAKTKPEKSRRFWFF